MPLTVHLDNQSKRLENINTQNHIQNQKMLKKKSDSKKQKKY